MSLALVSTCVGGRRAPLQMPVVVAPARLPPMQPLDLLTTAQLRTIIAVIEHGSDKLAAEAMRRSHKTVEAHLANARERLGIASRLHMLIAVDRLTREGAAQ